MPMDRSRYPADWEAVSDRVRFGRAGGRCEFPGCLARHGSFIERRPGGEPVRQAGDSFPYEHEGDDPDAAAPGNRIVRVVLTTAHDCDCDPLCADEGHLSALCQLHHLRQDIGLHARTRSDRRWAKYSASGQGSLFPCVAESAAWSCASSSAKFGYIDEVKTWRYELMRQIDNGPLVNFLMLNPSVADGTRDDPTMRRVIDFAGAAGFGTVVVTNLFGLISSTPDAIRRAPDPVGPGNDASVDRWIGCADAVVLAWGAVDATAGAGAVARAREVAGRALASRPVFVLGLTAAGHPRHPLMLPKSAEMVPWGGYR